MDINNTEMFEDKVQQKESIKLIKGSKGYNWEVRIFLDSSDDNNSFVRLKKIDDKLKEDYAQSVVDSV
jgi:hypothetical protein